MADSKKATPVLPKFGRGIKADSNKPAPPKDAADSDGNAPSVFRLPKFFTQGAEEGIAHIDDDADEIEDAPAPPVASAPVAAPAVASVTAAVPSHELNELRDEIERLTEQITQVNERESSLERVFDTLHAELSDYKNDFLYEHLKPVVRPLLFLFDSIEQFDSEIAMTEAAAAAPNVSAGTLGAAVVRENVHFFRDQLVEALRVCEVTVMEAPSGAFNPKFHKAVDVMPVEREQDGTIVRVVRSGWFLNGQLLRPAEVVVGKYRAPAQTPMAPAAPAKTP